MGGIGRPLNLFSELPNVGWDCDVLTVKPVAYRGYEEELGATLDQSRIFRSGSYDPQRILYLLGVRKVKAATIEKTRAASTRFFPDSKVGWVGPAVRFGRKILRAKKYDVILSSSPPISSHLVARQLAVEFETPWVADFRDYWSVTPVEQAYSDPAQIERGNRLLNDIRQKARRITAVNQSIADYLGHGLVIRNAYNEKLAEAWRPPTDHSLFRLGMLGHGVDRDSWLWLLDVLKEVERLNPKLASEIDLVQVGQANAPALESDVRERNLPNRIQTHGHLSRAATIEALNVTHAVYLGMSQPEGLQFVPGRVYDLLASGRPIISNAEPTSEIARIITGTGNGWCYSASDISAASLQIVDLAKQTFDGQLSIIPRPPYARAYGSRRQAESFAGLFEQLI